MKKIYPFTKLKITKNILQASFSAANTKWLPIFANINHQKKKSYKYIGK